MNKEQTFILQKNMEFEPKHIFECGQCFRWNLEQDGSYTGVVRNNVINVKKDKTSIVFKGTCEESIIKLCTDYFDLNRDYSKIKQSLAKIDSNMKKSIEYGNGIRILNQDLWETIISFIISANNNIPRIKGIIEKLSKKYGKKIIWQNKEYYTFPTPNELSNVQIEDLRALGLGFRDKRVYETTQMILNKEVDLEEIKNMNDTEKIKEQLLRLPGVGPKVAECIMLFSLNRFDVFPIDVWVRRVMNELYIKNNDETKVNRKQIEDLAKQKYKNLAGIAQQYLFYYKRENA